MIIGSKDLLFTLVHLIVVTDGVFDQVILDGKGN